MWRRPVPGVPHEAGRGAGSKRLLLVVAHRRQTVCPPSAMVEEVEKLHHRIDLVEDLDIGKLATSASKVSSHGALTGS